MTPKPSPGRLCWPWSPTCLSYSEPSAALTARWSFVPTSALANLNLVRILCLWAFALAPVIAFADDSRASSPDVRALVFFDPDTSQGKELFAFYLPGLFERYGDRLEVSGIDLSQTQGRTAYSEAAKRLSLPHQPIDAPVVVVGNRAIVGLFDIATSLGDDFEDLAKDPSAKSWPPDPALQKMLPDGIETVKVRVASEGVAQVESAPEPTGDRIANALAVAVLLGMVAALIHSLARLRRQNNMPEPGTSVALLLTLAIGLGISAYTAYTALADVEPMCGPIGNCAAVQESEYSKLFGIPLGMLGLIGYSLILVTWLIARYLSPQGGRWHWIPWAVALFGVLFSLRLTALEPFVIGEICIWCLGSAVSITAALWLLSGYTRKGGKVT